MSTLLGLASGQWLESLPSDSMLTQPHGRSTQLDCPKDEGGDGNHENATQQAITNLITNTGDWAREKLLASVRRCRRKLRIGTACSGSDIVVACAFQLVS
eukprot:9478336-Pyramimonas_sp.AAC.1